MEDFLDSSLSGFLEYFLESSLKDFLDFIEEFLDSSLLDSLSDSFIITFFQKCLGMIRFMCYVNRI